MRHAQIACDLLNHWSVSSEDDAGSGNPWAACIEGASDGQEEAAHALSEAVAILVGVQQEIEDQPPLDGDKVEPILEQATRNAKQAVLKWWRSQHPGAVIEQAEEYGVVTSQEMHALLAAMADGKSGVDWTTDKQAQTRTWERSKVNHLVQLAIQDDHRNLKHLEQITAAQDADGVFAVLYICRLLAPPAPLSARVRAAGWIDLDDVAERIGLQARNAEQREQNRQRVWGYIQFLAMAQVKGQRSIPYYDRQTRKEITTRIDSPIWRWMGTQRELGVGDDAAPICVEIVLAKEWADLLTSPDTAQYLPLGELLGSIPPNQPHGSWARVIGAALAGRWRRNPREALDGSLRMPRKELLDTFRPKEGDYIELLGSRNPIRARQYWDQAIATLVKLEFLAPVGDAAPSAKQSSLPRKGWQAAWLRQSLDLRPGKKMLPAVEACAKNLGPKRPRSLGPKKGKRGPR